MSERAVRFDFLGRDVSTGRTMRLIAKDADHLDRRFQRLGRSALLASSAGIIPAMASATAAAGAAGGAIITSLGAAGLAFGAFGAAAIPIIHKVTEATGEMTEQQTKFDTAARDSATALRRSTALTNSYADLLAELDPAQKAVVRSLQLEGTTWRELTREQQAALVEIRQTKDMYNSLLPAQKAAVTALLEQRDAWQALSPAQREAVLATDRLKTMFGAFQDELEPDVLGLYARSLDVAAAALKPMAPLAHAAADGLGTLMGDVERALGSSGFERGIKQLTENAAPAIVATGRSLGNIGAGFVGLFNTFAGNQSNLDNMVAATERFADASRNLDDNPRFRSFMDYVARTGPVVHDTLDDVGDALGDMLSAAAPLGPVSLELVSMMAQLASVTASLPGGLGTAALSLALYGPLAKRTAGALGLVGSGFDRVGGSITASGRRMDANAASTRNAAAQWSRFSTSMAVSGPMWAGFSSNAARAADTSQRWSRTVSGAGRVTAGFGTALSRVGAALPVVGLATAGVALAFEHNKRAAEANRQAIEAMFRTVHEGGVKGQQAGRAIDYWTDQLQRAQGATGVAGKLIRESAAGMDRAKTATDQWRQSLSTLDRQQMDVNRTQNDLTAALDTYASGSPEVRAATIAYQVAQSQLADTQNRLAEATKTATQRIHDQTETIQSAAEANTAHRQAVLSTQMAVATYTQTMRSGTATAAQLQQAENSAMQAIQGQARAAQSAALAQNALASAETRTAAGDRALRAEYVKLASQLAPGSALRKNVDALIRQLDAAAKSRTSTLKINIVTQHTGDQIIGGKIGGPGGTRGHAGGGLIRGPGTSTSDSIDARLSTGEYVLRAAAVDRIGVAALDALNSGRAASSAPAAAGRGGAGQPTYLSVPLVVDGVQLAQVLLRLEHDGYNIRVSAA